MTICDNTIAGLFSVHHQVPGLWSGGAGWRQYSLTWHLQRVLHLQTQAPVHEVLTNQGPVFTWPVFTRGYFKKVYSCESSSSMSYNVALCVWNGQLWNSLLYLLNCLSHSCLMFCLSVIFLSVPCTYVMFMYKCTQNQFPVQVYTKPVWKTHVHRTSIQNQFTL